MENKALTIDLTNQGSTSKVTCRNFMANVLHNHLRLPVAKTTTYGLETINTEAIFCGPYYHQKLKIPNPNLNSNGRSKNGMEIPASADYVKFMLEIWGFYTYRLIFFRLSNVIRFFVYFFVGVD